MHPKKKADEPAPAPQEPVAPAPAVEANERPPVLAGITAKMKAVKVGDGEGKRTKFTPTRTDKPFYVSPGETNLKVSKVEKEQYADITGVGASSSVKNIAIGARVWVVFLNDNTKCFCPSLSNVQKNFEDNLDNIEKIIPALVE
eukprot:g65689.t1